MLTEGDTRSSRGKDDAWPSRTRSRRSGGPSAPATARGTAPGSAAGSWQFFEGEIPDELGHATFLADKIVALGGTPTTAPAPVEVTNDNRRMLELALQAERDTVRRYKARAEQAEALGEVALKVRIEDIIVDGTHHAEEIQRILTNWKS